MSLNKVILSGNLGGKPDVKEFQNGGAIARFRVAMTERYRDRNGEYQKKTDWATVVVKAKGLVDKVIPWLEKGMAVQVVGRLEERQWEDAQGNKRVTTEVVIAGMNGELKMIGRSNQNGGQNADNGDGERTRADAGSSTFSNGPSSDIPF